MLSREIHRIKIARANEHQNTFKFYLGYLGIRVSFQCRLVNVIKDLVRVLVSRCRLPGGGPGPDQTGLTRFCQNNILRITALS